MRRNMFGDPIPKGYAEMLEALEESVYAPEECYAEIEFNPEESDFKGWTAEVRTSDSGDVVFSTLGYESKEELIKDLKSLDISEIQEL